jgi:hypothetical protein
MRIIILMYLALTSIGLLRCLCGGNLRQSYRNIKRFVASEDRSLAMRIWCYACYIVGLPIAFTIWPVFDICKLWRDMRALWR